MSIELISATATGPITLGNNREIPVRGEGAHLSALEAGGRTVILRGAADPGYRLAVVDMVAGRSRSGGAFYLLGAAAEVTRGLYSDKGGWFRDQPQVLVRLPPGSGVIETQSGGRGGWRVLLFLEGGQVWRGSLSALSWDPAARAAALTMGLGDAPTVIRRELRRAALLDAGFVSTPAEEAAAITSATARYLAGEVALADLLRVALVDAPPPAIVVCRVQRWSGREWEILPGLYPEDLLTAAGLPLYGFRDHFGDDLSLPAATERAANLFALAPALAQAWADCVDEFAQVRDHAARLAEIRADAMRAADLGDLVRHVIDGGEAPDVMGFGESRKP
jgi:hypothetical protein